jgi:hypothetical protein
MSKVIEMNNEKRRESERERERERERSRFEKGRRAYGFCVNLSVKQYGKRGCR